MSRLARPTLPAAAAVLLRGRLCLPLGPPDLGAALRATHQPLPSAADCPELLPAPRPAAGVHRPGGAGGPGPLPGDSIAHPRPFVTEHLRVWVASTGGQILDADFQREGQYYRLGHPAHPSHPAWPAGRPVNRGRPVNQGHPVNQGRPAYGHPAHPAGPAVQARPAGRPMPAHPAHPAHPALRPTPAVARPGPCRRTRWRSRPTGRMPRTRRTRPGPARPRPRRPRRTPRRTRTTAVTRCTRSTATDRGWPGGRSRCPALPSTGPGRTEVAKSPPAAIMVALCPHLACGADRWHWLGGSGLLTPSWRWALCVRGLCRCFVRWSRSSSSVPQSRSHNRASPARNPGSTVETTARSRPPWLEARSRMSRPPSTGQGGPGAAVGCAIRTRAT